MMERSCGLSPSSLPAVWDREPEAGVCVRVMWAGLMQGLLWQSFPSSGEGSGPSPPGWALAAGGKIAGSYVAPVVVKFMFWKFPRRLPSPQPCHTRRAGPILWLYKGGSKAFSLVH